MDKQLLIDVMKNEIEKSTGCTDPGSVSLAVAKATEVLGEKPDRVEVDVSPNVYKNGVSVGVPGTDGRGLDQAAALGVFLFRWTDERLGICDYVESGMVDKSKEYLEEGNVKIKYLRQVPDPLFIEARVYREGKLAWAKIQSDYSNIVETGMNGEVIFSKPAEIAEEKVDGLVSYSVSEIIETIRCMELAEIEFLIEAAKINKTASNIGIANGKAKIGSTLFEMLEDVNFPYSAMMLGKLYTASAAEARMIGLNVPIMAISGSGNHGITNFLGMTAAAEILGVSNVEFARGLAVSSAITIYIKGHIKRMTAFCGCSVAAATGVAAGTAYLLGGSYEDMVNAMHSVIGALAGIVCDGAKESCAYKLSTATSAAIEYAYLAKEKDVFIPRGNGIVGHTIEETFRNMGRLNNPGMLETDKCLLDIIESVQNENKKL
ncbi:MAG TPA: L-serine ammonia-lyase, iron-sulfur-dependent, subunit alpha [Clostridia bacterium]|nr:L-serine ammonia-lyase, iron-sulfur-dependent, subunit alpha [Clostridia bacterium]